MCETETPKTFLFQNENKTYLEKTIRLELKQRRVSEYINLEK